MLMFSINSYSACLNPAFLEGANRSYKVGDVISRNGKDYKVLYANWANNFASDWAYAPGTGTAWASAWKLIKDPCTPAPHDSVNEVLEGSNTCDCPDDHFGNSNVFFNQNRNHDLNGYNLGLINGNVGVGVVNPNEKLVVDGSIAFGYPGGSSYNGIKRDGLKTLFYNNITGTLTEPIYEFKGSGSRKLFSITQGGNVNIGASKGISKLNVDGTTTSGTLPRHGITSYLDATGSSADQYGFLSELTAAGSSGKKIGVYSKVVGAGTTGNVWAGFFKGKTEVSGDFIVGREGTQYLFYSHFDGSAFSIVPNKTSGADDWNWRVSLRMNKTGELIKRMEDESKVAFAVETAKDKHVFKVLGDGSVYATSLHVRLRKDFPDYVFHKDYKLVSLDSLETFINSSNHLPNIPSAEKIGDQIELGELTRLQQEKIEELTLYIIELNNRLKALEK
jgi:hypothetical protein